ncbi:MAG TPA: hypothetical protein VHT48_01185, partial [Methylocella sp.]|nr:hypothetical protein [Methylocella sp.]
NLFAHVEKREHHMAADIAGPACHQNRHVVTRTRNRLAILAQLGAKPLSYRVKMWATTALPEMFPPYGSGSLDSPGESLNAKDIGR